MKFLTQITAVLIAATLSSSSVLKTPSSSEGNFELLILHNNDMHARFEQTSQLSGACTTADRDAGKCYGGFPRVATVVKEARKAAASGQGPPVLYLNAGDTYTGTAWFTIYKWKIAAEFINALQPDAVSLGNNELQYGSNKLSPFLEKIETKILASNVILKISEETEKIQKSIVFDLKGVKVGVIGYLTPEANILDSTGNIEYIDEIIALKEEVTQLKALDVNIIIALGHSNVEKDLEIAKEVDGIDLVIGGHKNTFFWNGTSAETNLPNFDETIIVTQQSGRQVPVVQSYAYNKYLGQLNVKFDIDGEVTDYKTKHILLDALVPQDPDSLQIIKQYNKEIASMSGEVIGDTAVVLDGDSCKVQECNLGNLITDSIMYYYALEYDRDSQGWTDASIAIIHGGAIATSISPSNRPASITRGDLLSALPSESHIVAVSMKGTILLQALEHSVADYGISNPSEQFLQFSGIRVVYDLSKDPGSRLVSAVARCWSCDIPEFLTIDDSSDYKILMPSSLVNTYPMFTELPKEDFAYDEITCVAKFIKLRTPIYPEVAGRISLLNVDDYNSATTLRITTFIIFITLITIFVS